MTETLRTLGNDVPVLIDKLSNQQVKLAQIIQGAGENLTALESAVGQSTAKLESTLGNKTEQLQVMLEGYTSGLAMALGARTESLQDAISGYVATLDTSLSKRTESLQAVFEEYARALDTSLTNRAQALDFQLVERTKALDAAFGQRLKHFDEQIVRSTMVIDSAVAEKARALTSALDNHAKSFSDTISRQAIDLDESLVHGINSVRRTSENITRQSLKAIEGLSSQSEMLKSVSENLLSQIGTVTNRFEGQGQAIMKAANSLESANYKIDATLQGRHAELSQTIDRLSGKADEFGRFVEGYSSSIEGSISEAEARARATAEELRKSSELAKMSALKDLERFRVETGAEGDRALDDLRRRFSSISNVVSEQLTSLTSRFDQTSEDVRLRAARAAAEIASEQARLREQMDRLPIATRENAEAMRRGAAGSASCHRTALEPHVASDPKPRCVGAVEFATRTGGAAADVSQVFDRRLHGNIASSQSRYAPRSELAQHARQRGPRSGWLVLVVARDRPQPLSDSAASSGPSAPADGRGEGLVARRPSGAGLARGGRASAACPAEHVRYVIPQSDRRHRARARPGNDLCDLVAPQLRPARHHGAVDLYAGRARGFRRAVAALSIRPGAQAHGGPLSGGLRSHAPRSGAARSHGAHGEQPSSVRHGPRLSVPRSRERPHFLTHDRPSHGGPHTLYRSRNVGLEDRVRHCAWLEDRSPRRDCDGQRRRV